MCAVADSQNYIGFKDILKELNFCECNRNHLWRNINIS